MEEKKKENNHKKHLIKAYLDDSEYEKFISIAKSTKRSNSRVVRDMLDNAIFVESRHTKGWRVCIKHVFY